MSGRRTPRVRNALALCASLSLMAATACGFDDPADSGQTNLVVAGPAAVLDLDPLGAQAMEDATLIAGGHIYDTLVKIVDGQAVPSVATAWSNPDPNNWIFTLRSDVRFHDGASLSAEDVKASIERAQQGDGPLAGFWTVLDSVTASSATELRITTTDPFGGILVNLALLPIVPAGFTNFAEAVGSGPYKVDSFVPGETLVLLANDAHWDGKPAVDRIEFRNIPEASSRVTALRNHEIDFTWGLSPDQFGEVDGVDGLTLTKAASYQHYYAWFNAQRAPFDNIKVRQAVEHAIDWDTIMRDLFPGVATRATAPIPPSVFGFAANEPYDYSPEKAKALLAEAGLPNGFSTTMQFASTCCAQITELAQAIASDLAKVGITVQLLPKETGKWVEDLLALDWDINLANNVTVTGDANFTIGRLYTCAANRTGYCDPELDSLIAEARATIDESGRAAVWGQAGALIWQQAIGLFPFDIQQNYAFSDRVQGFIPPSSGNPVFTKVSIGA